MLENVDTIYKVPLKLFDEGLLKKLYFHFNLKTNKKTNLSLWKQFEAKFKSLKKEVNIAIVGKYTNLSESYKSLNEALFHSGIFNKIKVNISWIDSRHLLNKKNLDKFLKDFHGILVPGGFGKDGSEGKINAIKFAKENSIPFLGICFGMQLAIIESVRNLKGFENASSTEFGKTKLPIISMMHEWEKIKRFIIKIWKNLGGSMRLGSYQSLIRKNTLIYNIYKKTTIHERHRHRYEVNFNYLTFIKKSGVVLSGMSPNRKLVEIMERKRSPLVSWSSISPGIKIHSFFTSSNI